MTKLETSLTDKFRKIIKSGYVTPFIYKIPDTLGLGGKKPFDMLLILGGKTFCLEFKRGNITKATPYQRYHLDLAQANGATIYVVNEANMSQILNDIKESVNG